MESNAVVGVLCHYVRQRTSHSKTPWYKRGVAEPKNMDPRSVLKNNHGVCSGDQHFGSLRAITKALTQ